MSAEQMSATRTVAAAPAEVFAVLTDPDRHQDTEPGDWVRGAVTTEPITGVGQIFAMNMFLEQAGGHYVTHNLVTEFDQDRAIAWSPGQINDSTHQPGGWTWRYDLTPNNAGTDVTLTYDWSATPQATRDAIGGMPPFSAEFLADSLAALDHTLTGT
jgi:hypothetical protein